MSLSLVWTILHIFEQVVLLDTELVSLRYDLCFCCFFSRSPCISLSFSSNQSCCLRDMVLGNPLLKSDGEATVLWTSFRMSTFFFFFFFFFFFAWRFTEKK